MQEDKLFAISIADNICFFENPISLASRSARLAMTS